MALTFNVMVNEYDVQFSFEQSSKTIQIIAINGKPRSILCQTLPVSSLDEAMEQAMILSKNKQNTLFWHPV